MTHATADHGPTTRTLAGQTVTLVAGVRYWASREWCSRANRHRREWPVTIEPFPGSPEAARTVVLRGLSLDAANRFLAEFNNGVTSFDGRAW